MEAKIGQVICTAGRHVTCTHKRNATFLDNNVKGQICAISADNQVCKFAGKVME